MQAQENVRQLRSELHRAAIEYVERGWSIVPISLTSRLPLIKWESFQRVAPTLDVVNAWFTHGVETSSGRVLEGFGIGVITGAVSGLIVVDCDNAEAVQSAEDEGWSSPFAVKTRRGMHYYFKHPGGDVRFANKAGNMGYQGIDLRGDGGIIFAPPTTYFDADTGKHVHTYEWMDEELLNWNELPVWQGKPTVQSITSDSFKFSDVSLKDIDHKKPQTTLGEIVSQIAVMGRKLCDGDGRNNWLTKFIGERCKQVEGRQLLDDCIHFMDCFFEVPLSNHEVTTTLKSVVARDKRNHPERYGADGKLLRTDQIKPQADNSTPVIPELPQETPSAQNAFKPLYCEDLDDMIAAAGGREYWLQPIIEPNSITQVVGFNGSGKTFILMNALWAAACGKSFGPFESIRQPRVLYFDWELSLGIIADRMSDMKSIYGSPKENFALWSQASGQGSINLMNDKGVGTLLGWIEANKPDIVVMDTVRSAFRGMNENSPEEWSRVNALLKIIRDKGIAVVFVHHRNKPGMNGMGREAGSTAQLTDVDTQIVITKVCQSKSDADAQAARYDGNTKVHDLNGRTWTAYEYLTFKCKKGFTLKYVAELSYGKLRQPTELHVPHYIGLAQCIATGAKRVVSTLSPKQQALILNDGSRTPNEIASKLDIPVPLINEWLDMK